MVYLFFGILFWGELLSGEKKIFFFLFFTGQILSRLTLEKKKFGPFILVFPLPVFINFFFLNIKFSKLKNFFSSESENVSWG